MNNKSLVRRMEVDLESSEAGGGCACRMSGVFEELFWEILAGNAGCFTIDKAAPECPTKAVLQLSECEKEKDAELTMLLYVVSCQRDCCCCLDGEVDD